MKFKGGILLLLVIFTAKPVTLFCQPVAELKVDKAFRISSALGEISGMALVKDTLYAINDSGNGNYIFLLSFPGFEILERIKVKNAVNIDWEDISYFDGNIYIGDFGNNYGNRKNLAIYRINLQDFISGHYVTEQIAFVYSAQNSFLNHNHKHLWDCESMTVDKTGIWLFSKNWLERKTIVYRLREIPGNLTAVSASDTLNIPYLVTGTYYDPDRRELMFCGYLDNKCYMSITTGFYPGGGFNGQRIDYRIPDLENTQVESLIVRNGYIYLASERSRNAQRIYRIIRPQIDD